MYTVVCFQYTIGTVGGAAAAVGAGLGVSYVMMKQALFFSVYLLFNVEL